MKLSSWVLSAGIHFWDFYSLLLAGRPRGHVQSRDERRAVSSHASFILTVSCLPIRTNSGASWMMPCAGGQQCVWYHPEVLCQRAINRSEGHPLTPPPPSHSPGRSHSTTPHLQLSTHERSSQQACPVNRQRAVSHDAALSRENPSTRRGHAPPPLPFPRLHSWDHLLRVGRKGTMLRFRWSPCLLGPKVHYF